MAGRKTKCEKCGVKATWKASKGETSSIYCVDCLRIILRKTYAAHRGPVDIEKIAVEEKKDEGADNGDRDRHGEGNGQKQLGTDESSGREDSGGLGESGGDQEGDVPADAN